MSITGTVSAINGTVNLREYVGNISQTAPITAPNALIIADAGAVTLTNPINNVSTLAGYSNGGTGFQFVNGAGFAVGSVTGSHGVLDFGSAGVKLTALTGDLQVSDTTYGTSAVTGVLELTAVSGTLFGTGIVQGGTATLVGANGINLQGSANLVDNLSAHTTSSGGIAFINNKALNVTSLGAAPGGTISVSTVPSGAYDLAVTGNVDTQGASLGLSAGGVLSVAAGKTLATGSGALSLNGRNGVTIASGASLISNASLTINATSGSKITNGGTLTAPAVTLTASKMALGGGTIAAANRVTLDSREAAIELGGMTTDLQSNVLELSNAELNSVTTPDLNVGSVNAGALTIVSPLTGDSGGALEHIGQTLVLVSNSSVSQASGATIGGVANLKLAARGSSVNLTEANTVSHIAGAAGSNFAYRTTGALAVDAISTFPGIVAGGNVTLTAGSAASSSPSDLLTFNAAVSRRNDHS